MTKTDGTLVCFVISDENSERLVMAKRMGLSKKQVLNEVLKNYFNDYLELQANALKKAAVQTN